MQDQYDEMTPNFLVAAVVAPLASFIAVLDSRIVLLQADVAVQARLVNCYVSMAMPVYAAMGPVAATRLEVYMSA